MHSTAQNLDSRTEIDSTNQTRQPRLKNSDSRPQNLSYLGLGNPLQNRDSTTQTRDSRLETPEPTLENQDWRTLTRDPRMFWGLASVLESVFESRFLGQGSRVQVLGSGLSVLHSGSRVEVLESSSLSLMVWSQGSCVRVLESRVWVFESEFWSFAHSSIDSRTLSREPRLEKQIGDSRREASPPIWGDSVHDTARKSRPASGR